MNKWLMGLGFWVRLGSRLCLPAGANVAGRRISGWKGEAMQVADMQRNVVTWQDAEDALIGALEYLAALPDRERGFLSAGSRSGWPQVLRIEQSDYPDRVDPSVRVGRREMAVLEAMLLGPRCAAMAIREDHRALVGRVLVMKRWQSPGGFRWEEVWMREGGKRCGTTSDALRMRYERAVGKVAQRMEQSMERGT